MVRRFMMLQTVFSLVNMTPYPVHYLPVRHCIVLLVHVMATQDLDSDSCFQVTGRISIVHSVDDLNARTNIYMMLHA